MPKELLRQDGYFNPRSRVGNDASMLINATITVISIHVPAWGTTTELDKMYGYNNISIHVPAWGTTASTIALVDSD